MDLQCGSSENSMYSVTNNADVTIITTVGLESLVLLNGFGYDGKR